MSPSQRHRPGIGGVQLDNDELRFATGDGKNPEAAAPTAPTVDPAELVAKEGEAFPGEDMEKVGTQLPTALLDQLEGLMLFIKTTDVPGITTKSDVYRIGVHRLLTEFARKFNDGKPFPVPRQRRRRP